MTEDAKYKMWKKSLCANYCRRQLKAYLSAAKRRFGMDLEVDIDALSDREASDMWAIVMEEQPEGEMEVN